MKSTRNQAEKRKKAGQSMGRRETVHLKDLQVSGSD